MCLNVYVAADRPLPTVAWSDADPGFYVRAAEPEEVAALSHVLGGTNIVYAGSFEGCGCGFVHEWATRGGHVSAQRSGPDEEKAVSSTAGLAEYLRQNAAGGRLELYSCWQGDEAAEAVAEIRVGPESLEPSRFVVREGEHVTIG